MRLATTRNRTVGALATALAGGVFALVGASAPALAGIATPTSTPTPTPTATPTVAPTPGTLPNCNLTRDAGGPCVAAAYGLGDPYSNGSEICLMAAVGQLQLYAAQGYRSASCQLQYHYSDNFTLLVLYK